MGVTVSELEHTADTGIRVEADSVAELFAGAADAMFRIMYELPDRGTGEERRFGADLADPEEALWSWLSDLLSHAEADDVAFAGIEAEVADGLLEATMRPVPLTEVRAIGPPIKAVTWHGLAVQREGNRWIATVVFDI